MEHLVIHYNDGNKKEDLYFNVKTNKDVLNIIMNETAPEKLWARGWVNNKNYIWNEVR